MHPHDFMQTKKKTTGATKKAAPTRAAGKKTAPKKTASKKVATKKTAAKKVLAKKALPKKGATKKSAAKVKTPVTAKRTTRRTATKVGAKKTVTTAPPRHRRPRPAARRGTGEARRSPEPQVIHPPITTNEPAATHTDSARDPQWGAHEDIHSHSKPEVQLFRQHEQVMRSAQRRPTVRGH